MKVKREISLTITFSEEETCALAHLPDCVEVVNDCKAPGELKALLTSIGRSAQVNLRT